MSREKVKGYENIPPNLRESIRSLGARGILLLPTVGTETSEFMNLGLLISIMVLWGSRRKRLQ